MATSGPDGFQWDRPVPKDWQDAMDLLMVGDNVSRLVIHWSSGFPYAPVQRYAIWEVLPYNAVAKILDSERQHGVIQSMTQNLWRDLQGPDPRTDGRWVKDRHVGKKWLSKSLVSREQWLIHQQTGGLPQKCWIIQGDKGGHAWQFGPFERRFLLALGADPEAVLAMAELWPNPGSLPYADFDDRVMTALTERDKLRQWREGMSWDGRSDRKVAGEILDLESRTRHEWMMQRMVQWINNQIGDAVSDIPRSLVPELSEYQRTDKAADDDAAMAALLEE